MQLPRRCLCLRLSKMTARNLLSPVMNRPNLNLSSRNCRRILPGEKRASQLSKLLIIISFFSYFPPFHADSFALSMNLLSCYKCSIAKFAAVIFTIIAFYVSKIALVLFLSSVNLCINNLISSLLLYIFTTFMFFISLNISFLSCFGLIFHFFMI